MLHCMLHDTHTIELKHVSHLGGGRSALCSPRSTQLLQPPNVPPFPLLLGTCIPQHMPQMPPIRLFSLLYALFGPTTRNLHPFELFERCSDPNPRPHANRIEIRESLAVQPPSVTISICLRYFWSVFSHMSCRSLPHIHLHSCWKTEGAGKARPGTVSRRSNSSAWSLSSRASAIGPRALDIFSLMVDTVV